MRKQITPIAGACAAAIIALACPRLSAQTTFGASNDPSATIAVEAHGPHETAVSITRVNRGTDALPFSSQTVLRDAATGIAYPLRTFRKSLSKDGRYTITHAIFRGFDGPVARFDLIDPLAQQRALYITRIGEPEVVTASAE